jgi:ubiquinone/menaquinone biosynthesis C-methylase UbiE
MSGDQKIVSKFFQSTAGDWETIYSHTDVHSRLYQQRRDEVLSLAADLRLLNASHVLDAGCGPGLIAISLARLGLKIDAIDSVLEMVQMTRNLAIQTGVNASISTTVADALQIPIKDERYDLVVAVGLTEWIANVTPALQELFRLLKPGGYLIVTAANRWSLHFVLDPLKNPLVLPVKWLVRKVMVKRPQSYTRSSVNMARYLSSAGFDMIRTRRFGFGPFTFFGRRVFSDTLGWKIHTKLQALADQQWPILRSTPHVYIALAKKPVKNTPVFSHDSIRIHAEAFADRC